MTFLPNIKLTSVPSDPGATTLIGDYSGLAATPTSVVAAWGDLRFSNLAVFVARGDLAP